MVDWGLRVLNRFLSVVFVIESSRQWDDRVGDGAL